MKGWSTISHTARWSLATLIRVPLAFAVALLFSHAGVPQTIVTAKDRTITVEKAVEGLHVDFSSKVSVPDALNKSPQGFYLLPEPVVPFLQLTFLGTFFSQFLGTIATNTCYAFVSINAP